MSKRESSLGATAAADYDVVVVGGGLAGQLCVLALAARAPSMSVALVEHRSRLGGSQTWCCHRSDLTIPAVNPSLFSWFSPLVDTRWSGYQVRFPGFVREIEGEYLCLRSQSLARATEQSLSRPRCQLLTQRTATALADDRVILADGQTLRARLVLDARGGELARFERRAGYQKFVGWEIDVEAGHKVPVLPVLMDATVPQVDGYRFVYTLPFSPTRLLVEDTYFSRTSDLDIASVRNRLHAHLHAIGLDQHTLVREEVGILPMPWAGQDVNVEPLALGYRGGFFHPGTAYSLPRAAWVADRLAQVAATVEPSKLAAQAIEALDQLRSSWRADDRFARLLNRLAFRAWAPERLRDAVFAPVYRLPSAVLARFYAGRTSLGDRLAIAAAPTRLSRFRRTAEPTPAPAWRSP
jgi:lycopene beta-cyclase